MIIVDDWSIPSQAMIFVHVSIDISVEFDTGLSDLKMISTHGPGMSLVSDL